jgi:hypothetical protein
VTRVPVEIAADVARKSAEVRKKESTMHRYFSAPDFSLAKYEAWKKSQPAVSPRAPGPWKGRVRIAPDFDEGARRLVTRPDKRQNMRPS